MLHGRWELYGLPESGCRTGFQTTSSCRGKEPQGSERRWKGVRWRRQVRNEKTNGSEPLMTRRKAIQPTSKPSSVVGSGQAQTLPVYGLSGVRRGGGVISFQALMGNVGTCRFDGKGEIRRGSPPKEKSTEAKHWGGAARSSGEAIERLQSEGAASSGRSCVSTRKGRSA
ncbi:hypothetical protein SAMN05920897_1161 [Alkalispirochaeta americana]|uniref:Uncharacterized protein n=1 Tax=Alkalispirochaeta americana TaxID=159291 RepID=A0A1N6VWA5_9SPIO|nr:hypothetical protein SAMN05920897_1161 [Alkalispirochaeta americana]